MLTMGRISCTLLTVTFILCLAQMQGMAHSRFSKPRFRRDAMFEDVEWQALNYTFYTNPDAFLLIDSEDGSTPTIDRGDNSTSEGLYTHQLIGSSNVRRTLIKAASGPFWVQKELFPIPSEPFSNLDIRAHLVQEEILPFASSINVLFSVRERDPLGGGEKESRGVRPCLRAVARFDNEESEASCMPQGETESCVVKIPLPFSWHERSQRTNLDGIAIVYSVFTALSARNCEPHGRNSISPEGAAAQPSTPLASYEIGTISLLSWDGKLDAVEDDGYVRMYVPGRRLGIGERFIIPITISRMYLDGDCTVKAKARKGISAISVQSTSQEQWNTLSMVKQSGTFAIVTAVGLGSNQDGATTTSPDENPLLFVMEFEVLNDTETTRIINWRIDCTLRGEARASRFGTDISVSDTWIQAILPIPKESSIVNTALMTGREVSVSLDVFVVTHLGDIMDAAGQARCQSPNVNVLKVQRSCTNIYLDGTETSGSELIDIQVNLQGHSTWVRFSVWVPELPLQVSLSDEKLSGIRSWKVGAGRQDEGILEPEQMLNGEGDSNRSKCRLMYQLAKVEVYTRFYAPNANSMSRPDGKRIYLFGESKKQSVTNLVKDQLAALDHSIAQVEGTKVIARVPGNTQIQVIHPQTRNVLGEAALTVAADKVNIANLSVMLVSGMTLQVDDVEGYGSRVKLASIEALSDLFVQHQEAILDATLTFDDGTSLALRDVSTNEYTVAITTLDPGVVLESPDSMQAYPSLIAMGEGSTTIMLEVGLSKPCMKRRRSSTIAYDVVPINVTFNNPKYTGLVAMGNGAQTAGTEGLWRSLTKVPGAVDYGIVRTNFDLLDTGGGKRGSSVISSIPIDIDFNNMYPMGPDGSRNNALDDPEPPTEENLNESDYSDEAKRLSAIEIGMYVLLGVFSLAILGFMINCILFMARHHKAKRIPKTHQGPPYPQNWMLFGAYEERPQAALDPAENLPLRHKDEGEGSSRDEAIGTESEVSIERHSSEECQRLHGRGIEETSLIQVPPPQGASDSSQEPDCGVVMDGDDNEEAQDQAPRCDRQNDSCQCDSGSEFGSGVGHRSDAPVTAGETQPDNQTRIMQPPLNTNQSNSCSDVRITFNPSDENIHLKSGLEGMGFAQIVNYLDNLKESCT